MLYTIEDIAGEVHEFTESELAQLLVYPIDQYYNSAFSYGELMRVCKTPGFPGVTLKFIATVVINRYSEIMELSAKNPNFGDHVYSCDDDFDALEFFFNYLSNKRDCIKVREEFFVNLVLTIATGINRAYGAPLASELDKTNLFSKKISDQIWQRISESEICFHGIILFVNYLYRELVHNELGEETIPETDVIIAQKLYDEWSDNELNEICQEPRNKEQADDRVVAPSPDESKPQPEQEPNDTEYLQLREQVENNLIYGVLYPEILLAVDFTSDDWLT